MRKLWVTFAVAVLMLVGIPAQADMYPIPTEKVPCQYDRSRLQVDNGNLVFTARWAIGGISDPQHWNYAKYVKVRVGGVTYETTLSVVYYIKNTDKCVAAKLTSANIPYHNENHARVKSYDENGLWGGTDIYRHLNK